MSKLYSLDPESGNFVVDQNGKYSVDPESGNFVKNAQVVAPKETSTSEALLPRAALANKTSDIPVDKNAPHALELEAANAFRKPLAYTFDALSGIGRGTSALAKSAMDVANGERSVKDSTGQARVRQDIKNSMADPRGTNAADATLRSPLFIPTLAAAPFVGPAATTLGALGRVVGSSALNAGVNQADNVSQGKPVSGRQAATDFGVGLLAGGIPMTLGRIGSSIGKGVMNNAEKSTLKTLGYNLNSAPEDIALSEVKGMAPAYYQNAPTTSNLLKRYGSELDFGPGTKPEVIYNKVSGAYDDASTKLKTVLNLADKEPSVVANVKDIDISKTLIDPIKSKVEFLANKKGISPEFRDGIDKVLSNLDEYSKSLTSGVGKNKAPMTLEKLYSFKQTLNSTDFKGLLTPTNDAEKAALKQLENLPFQVETVIAGKMPLTKANLTIGNIPSYTEFSGMLTKAEELNKLKSMMDKAQVKENIYLDKLTGPSPWDNIRNADISKPLSLPIVNQIGSGLTKSYKLGKAGELLGNALQRVSPSASNYRSGKTTMGQIGQ